MVKTRGLLTLTFLELHCSSRLFLPKLPSLSFTRGQTYIMVRQLSHPPGSLLIYFQFFFCNKLPEHLIRPWHLLGEHEQIPGAVREVITWNSEIWLSDLLVDTKENRSECCVRNEQFLTHNSGVIAEDFQRHDLKKCLGSGEYLCKCNNLVIWKIQV